MLVQLHRRKKSTLYTKGHDTNLQPILTSEKAPATMEETTWPPVMKMLLTTVILPLRCNGETSLRYTGTAMDAKPASGGVFLERVLVFLQRYTKFPEWYAQLF